MDVSDMASVQAGYEAAVQAFGGVDILVSNAGICRLGDFLTQSDADRDAHLDINVKGAWNTCKAVLPGMVARKMCIRDRIRAMLADEVDAIATDHAPHTPQDKQNGAPGCVGLETAFSVCYTKLCRQHGMPLSCLLYTSRCV